MDYQQILELVKEVSKAGLTNFEYTEGNIRIAMSCPQPEEKIVVPASNLVLQEAAGAGANTVETAAPAQQEPEQIAEEKGGNVVKKGQTLAIVEAMKLMNEIESEFDGVVTEILVENEDNVEYGQPLFRIQ